MTHYLTLGLILLLALCSCEMTRDMKDMHGWTREMMDTTRGMQEGTDNMYQHIRPKEAQEARDRNFRRLDEVEIFEEKLTKAATYFQAFEYQLWTNGLSSWDTPAYRYFMMTQAVDEFFRSLNAFLPPRRDKWEKLSPANKKNSTQNLYVLAITMGEIHFNQELMVKKYRVKKYTMLSMIEETLAKKDDYENGNITLTDWERSVLEWAEEAELLLQLRFNILSAIILAEVSTINKKYGLSTLGMGALLNKLRHLWRPWKTLFLKANRAQQEEIIVWLKEALRVKEVTQRIGIETKLNKKIKKILSKMKIPQECTDCNQHTQQRLNAFRQGIEQLLQ